MPTNHPSRRRALTASAAACALLAALGLSGCERSSRGAHHGAPELGTVERLVERGMSPDARRHLEVGDYKFLAEVAHPVLSSAKPTSAHLACDPIDPGNRDAARHCTASLPRAMADVPFAVFTTTIIKQRGEKDADTPAAAPQPQDTPAAPVHQDPTTRTFLVERGATVDVGLLNPPEIFFAQLYPVPALEDRTLTSEPFVVPPGALLRLSIGVSPPAWVIDSAPVYFRVVEVDQHDRSEQDLFRRVLDPARHAEDRRWFDSDIDLSYLAGKTIRLRFVTEPAEKGERRPSLPLWGDPRVLAPQARHPRPSIVLVSLDTLRARSMSTYGAPYETSPGITALAAQGALFEHAFTTFSNTLPSHMSMLTGLYPATHGVLMPPASLGRDHATLAEILRAAGYATAAFTEDALLDARRGFDRGFSTYYENTAISVGAGDAAGTFGRALEWAGRNADEGFFLFVHTYEVHAPYHPPEAYKQLFDDPKGELHGIAERVYLQEIRYVDDVLQRLVAGLRKVVPERDLLLVVTADHGEEFGEHGMLSHTQLYDEVMHVPLMMIWPGRIPAGLRVPTLVSLVDVSPTILDLAGIPVPAAMEGKSLVPLLRAQPGTIPRDVVFGESPPISSIPEPRFVARSADAKCMLTASDHGDACFDLTQDPGEHQPHGITDTVTFANLSDLAAKYRARSLATRARRAEQHSRARHAIAPAAQQPPRPGNDADDGNTPAVERKLRALGYVE